MKANIPSSALPAQLSEPNKLSTTYTTNVLIPKLGPSAVNGYVRLGALLIRDLASAVSLIEKVKDYSKNYNVKVTVVRQPDEWLRERVVFKPTLERGDIYSKVFVGGLSAFNDVEINDKLHLTNVKQAATAGDQPVAFARRSAPSIVAVGTPSGEISAITDIGVKEMKLINGRVASFEFTPARMMTEKEDVFMDAVGYGETLKINSQELDKAVEQQKKAYLLGNIMHGFSQPNSVVADLLQAKVLNKDGALVKNTLLESDDVATQVVKELHRGSNVTDANVDEVGQLIDHSLTLLESSGLQDNSFLKAYRKDAGLRKLVKIYCIDKFNGLNMFGVWGLPNPTTPINHSREWAFQRTERMDILMNTPEFRGPFSAESVTPNSTLTISESLVNEQFDFSERSEGSVQQKSSERSVFTSSSFKSALSNMTESGISDDNSFTNNSTLLNTLREQKRAAVDRTLSNISIENENLTVSGSRNTSSTSRTYTTRGKDPKFATTELAFQVVSKVDVEVHLENVDLVWAPYIYSPFLYTHQIIRNYKETSIFEYIEQNNVVDPVRPLEEYEIGSFKKEIAIEGSETSQSKNFDFPIPAQWIGDGWELDKAGTTIEYRNGTSDDYDIWDRPNWDDLENWDRYFKSLAATSDRVFGEATLETTDPEFFNKGFLVFNFQMRRLSERSKADLRAYAAEQVSAEAERRAVISRARQYGELRKEELITRYAQSLDLQEEAFNALIKRVFVGFPAQDLSYYKEIIRSCINWNNVTMQFDYNRSNNLPFAEYSRSHFMNAPGIRFILPIIRSAEDVFFDNIRRNGNNYYESAITEVKDYTNNYRDKIEEFRTSDPEKLILDKYSRDIVLGRHYEAVMSNHPFAE